MPIYALGDVEPEIHPEAWVHPEAVVIGRVTIGPLSTIWPCAVLRGDDAGIVIGARTSVQDGAVLHNTETLVTSVGDECVVGHLSHLEGCTIEDGALVGTASVVLHRAVVGREALVAANVVVTNGMVVPPRALALGVPAKIREGAADYEETHRGMHTYLRRRERYLREMRRIG